jgi:8-oxo-dGTP diphosphatase
MSHSLDPSSPSYKGYKRLTSIIAKSRYWPHTTGRLPSYNVLVGSIVIRAGHVLLLQRSAEEKFLPGAWGIPAGKVEFGESPDEAALRELKEEAGICGTVRQIVGFSWFHSTYKSKPKENLQINLELECEPGETVALGPSSQAYRWMPIDRIEDSSIPLDDFVLDTIRQAL